MTIENEDMGVLESIGNEIADAVDGTRIEYHGLVERLTDYSYDRRAITELILRAVLDELAYRELILSDVKTTRDYEIRSERHRRNDAAAKKMLADHIACECGSRGWVGAGHDLEGVRCVACQVYGRGAGKAVKS